MSYNIECLSKKFYVPTGITGSISAFDNNLVTVLPGIKNKIYVSFNVDDCKKMNIEVLHESIINQAVEIINKSRSNKKRIKKKLSFEDKKLLVLQEGDNYNLNGYLKPLNGVDIKYYKDLFATLSCFTGLEFEIVEEGFYNKAGSEYKISACGVQETVLRTFANQEARAFYSFGESPTQCFVAVDDYGLEEAKENKLALNYRNSILGHEMLHCLGLNHPKYHSLKENKDHRSIMEDVTPLTKKCNKLSGFEALKCINVPAMPTGEDICSLNKLYDSLPKESSVCYDVMQRYVTQYPDLLALNVVGLDDQLNDSEL
jgi:hypothetical protein